MRVLFVILSLLLATQAMAKTEALLCDPAENPIEPDMQLQESWLTFEQAEKSMKFLRGRIPEWINKNVENGWNTDLSSGELGWAYYNNLNIITGYMLKTEAEEEQAEDKPGEKTQAFCDFIYSTPIMD